MLESSLLIPRARVSCGRKTQIATICNEKVQANIKTSRLNRPQLDLNALNCLIFANKYAIKQMTGRMWLSADAVRILQAKIKTGATTKRYRGVR